LAGRNASHKDVVATLPESEQLYCSGSGFFISEDGYFLTNDHVVKNAHRVKLKIGGDFFDASIVREDADHDLALLKTEGTFKALRISSHEAELGQAVFTIGFPDIKLQGTEPKYTDGKISSVTGLQDNPDEYQISVPVQPGNSGGPLVDTAGNIKGIIVARLNDLAALQSMGSLPQNVNYAIKGRVLREFVSQSPDINLVSTSGTQADGVATVRQAVALVLVYQ
jgi:S1-C subfamily serine protease